ncbi:MAG TPA: hypothetical protein VF219_17475 [Vicinamibacterales bacterium]
MGTGATPFVVYRRMDISDRGPSTSTIVDADAEVAIEAEIFGKQRLLPEIRWPDGITPHARKAT